MLGQAATHLLGFHPTPVHFHTPVGSLTSSPVTLSLRCVGYTRMASGCWCSPPALCLCILRSLAAKASLFLWVYFYPDAAGPAVGTGHHSVIPWCGDAAGRGCGWDCCSGAFPHPCPASQWE